MTAPPRERDVKARSHGRSESAAPVGRPLLPLVPFSNAVRLVVVLGTVILAVVFVLRIRSIIDPFIWAILVAYLLSPIVSFLNDTFRIPRFLIVLGLYLIVISALVVASRYLVPWISNQITYFVTELPKLEGSLVNKVGQRPLGINISQVVSEISSRLNGFTSNPKAATKLLTSAFSTILRILIFLFTTFYLLMDAPRIRRSLARLVPISYRPEITRLSAQINRTWMQYIRGELILFGIMSVASLVGLEILQVPGAVPLALATGVLELLPIVGPVTAGALAVSVAYLNSTNPFGWSQVTYGIVVAAMYFAFREIEDYIVVPRVLGHAVKLHPLIVLFALTSGGIMFGLLGLLLAVPLAASIKIVGAYLYDKVVLQPPQFIDVHAVADDS